MGMKDALVCPVHCLASMAVQSTPCYWHCLLSPTPGCFALIAMSEFSVDASDAFGFSKYWYLDEVPSQ
eukprot:2273708-Amphidinium_carterae.1